MLDRLGVVCRSPPTTMPKEVSPIRIRSISLGGRWAGFSTSMRKEKSGAYRRNWGRRTSSNLNSWNRYRRTVGSPGCKVTDTYGVEEKKATTDVGPKPFICVT